MGRTDPRARSLNLFAPRLHGTYLAFGGFHGNVISAADLCDEEPDNPEFKKLAQKAGKSPLIEWDKAGEDLWQLWFKHLQDRGVTALRLFPRRRDNGDVLDLCGNINKPLLDLMHRFMEVAQPFGIHFLLIVMPEPARTGYVKKPNLKWVLPAFDPKKVSKLPPEQKRFVVKQQTVSMADYFTDPDVWACQRRYLDALIPWVKDEPQIFALEVVNEQGWWDEKFHWEQEEAIEAWGGRVIDYIHKQMPNMPVGVSHPPFGILGYEPLRWGRETSMDFYSPHIYSGTSGDKRGVDIGLATEVALNYATAGKPAFVGEWGVRSPKIDPRLRQLALRDAIWFSVLNGCPGLFQSPLGGRYADEYKKARAILEPLALNKLERQRPLVGIDITRASHDLGTRELYDAKKADALKFVSKKAEGDAYLELARCTEYFLKHGVAFDFTLEPKSYPISADPGHIAAVTVPADECLFAFSPVYQCKYAAFGDWETIVAYFRNVDGAVSQGCNLRRQVPRPFQVAWQLPKRPRGAEGGAWHYRLTVHNLDTGEIRQNRVARESSVDFGNASASDYVFVFER